MTTEEPLMPDTPAATDTPRTEVGRKILAGWDRDNERGTSHMVDRSFVSEVIFSVEAEAAAIGSLHGFREGSAQVAQDRDDKAAATPQVQADPPAEGLPCPTGCGCRVGTDDSDHADCGCDGPCCWDSWDDYIADVLNRPDYYDELRTARGLPSSLAATPAAKPEAVTEPQRDSVDAGAGLDEQALRDAFHATRMCKDGGICHGIAHDDEDEDGYRARFLAAYAEAASPRSDAGSEG